MCVPIPLLLYAFALMALSTSLYLTGRYIPRLQSDDDGLG